MINEYFDSQGVPFEEIPDVPDEVPENETETKPRTFTIRTPDEILGMEFDDSDNYLGDRVLAAGQPLVIAGAGGTGKSRLLLQLAAACVSGREFCGFPTNAQGKRWLIIQGENSNRRLQHDLGKLRAWLREDWPLFAELVHIHTLETDEDAILNLDDPEVVARIERVIAETLPDLVGFDTLQCLATGDLNQDVAMRQTVLKLSFVTKKGNPERSPVILHHSLTGKAAAGRALGYDRASFARNSKVLHGWTRAQINIAPGSPDNNDLLVMTCGKNNNGREFEPRAIKLDTATMIYDVDEDFSFDEWIKAMASSNANSKGVRVVSKDVWEVLSEPMKKTALVKALVEETGCGRSGAYNAVQKAEKEGVVHRSKVEGTYQRTRK